MDGRTVYVVLTNDFEEIEAVTVIDILRRAEIDVSIVSITDSLFVVGSHGIEIKADVLFDEVDFENGHALILPGGPGTVNYNRHEKLLNIIKKYNDQHKLIAAICAAPMALAGLGILDGKNAVTYDMDALSPNVKLGKKHTIRDDNIITSKAAATSPYFAFAIVEAIRGVEVMKIVFEKMRYDLI